MTGGKPSPVAEFAERVRGLREDAGEPSLKRLVELTRDMAWPLARSTIGDKLNGKSVVSWEFVASFVTACATHARSAGRPLAPELTELRAWDKAHAEMLDAVAADRAETLHAKAARGERGRRDARSSSPRLLVAHGDVAGGAPRSAASWDAFHLGVHKAISVDTAAAQGLPSLTTYVERAHDRKLRETLAEPAQSVLVILVGGSSTGKTRAAWEAIRVLHPDWPLARPANAHDLIEYCQFDILAPGTVLWLNEAQGYFEGADGPAAAEALRLRLESRSLIIAIGTMWPQFWQTFTIRPHAGSPDLHRQVRELLETAEMIPVPEGFSSDPEELARLERLSKHDHRLAVAVNAAGSSRRIVQVLAGGEQLISHYILAGTTNPVGWAIITAAMDARRLGCRAPIPPLVLHDAAGEYLSASQRASQPSDWFERAVGYATTELKGIAALTAVRDGTGIGEPDGYLLADYLDQHARTARGDDLPPGALWDALASHVASPDDLDHLAYRADARHLYRHALMLAIRAAEAGNSSAIRRAAIVLERAGYSEEAVAWAGRTGAPRWSGSHAKSVSEILAMRDEQELQRRGLAGDSYAMVEHATLLMEAGRYEDAEGWLRYAELMSNDPNITWAFADLLERTGRYDMAERYWGWLVESGDADAMRHLAGLQSRTGRDADAEHWLRRAATSEKSHSTTWAMRDLANLLDRTHRPGESEYWLRKAAEAGDLLAKCDLLDRAGRSRDAEQLMRHGLERGSVLAESALLERLERTGRADEADRLRKFGIDPGGKTASRWRPADGASQA